MVLLIAGPMIGVIVLVVVGASLAAWARFGGERWVLASIGGRDADPVADARLWNLAEGLSISAGLRQPRLVVDRQPRPQRHGRRSSARAGPWSASPPGC